MTEWLLRRLAQVASRRGRAGDRRWLLVSAAVWLVLRDRGRRQDVVWRGRVSEGQTLAVRVGRPGTSGSVADAAGAVAGDASRRS
jgi:predicted LPLAT superfamily acyltransferase